MTPQCPQRQEPQHKINMDTQHKDNMANPQANPQHNEAKSTTRADPNTKEEDENQISEDFWSSLMDCEPLTPQSASKEEDDGLQFLELLRAEAIMYAQEVQRAAKQSNNTNANTNTNGDNAPGDAYQQTHMSLLSEDAVLAYRRNVQRMAMYEQYLAEGEQPPGKHRYVDYPSEEVQKFWQPAPKPAPEFDWEQEYLESLSLLDS